MTTEALHPDLLKVGEMVGPWRILEILGSGGFGRVFKVERDGLIYTLKMAVRPNGIKPSALEEDVDARMAREAAAMLAQSAHPGLPRVHALDRWPNTREGYRFIVTDYVEGVTFHEHRWQKLPNAAELVDLFSGVVRWVDVLHKHGVYHRDLKGENIVVRDDGAPFLIDFGVASLPGASALSGPIPPTTFYLLPPEAVAFMRSDAAKKGERLQRGEAADLYALGFLLYESLTDRHPFDTKMADTDLLAAIETFVPRPPHVVNPRVPKSLSDITMRLLSKKPEDRYPSAQALLQALWEASKERKTAAWQVQITDSEALLRAIQEHFARTVEERGDTPNEDSSEGETQEVIIPLSPPAPSQEPSPEPVPMEARGTAQKQRVRAILGVHIQRNRSRRLRVAVACLTGLVCLAVALWLLPATLAPPNEAGLEGSAYLQKGSESMPIIGAPNSPAWRGLLAWICTVSGIGCVGMPVKPPASRDCSPEAVRAMIELRMVGEFGGGAGDFDVAIDPNKDRDADVTLRNGPIKSKVLVEPGTRLVEGSYLHGFAYLDPEPHYGIRNTWQVWYTQATLPGGRKVPVCLRSTAVFDNLVVVEPVTRWP